MVAAASSATCHKSLRELRQQRALSYQFLSARAVLPGSIVAGGGAFILITSVPVYGVIKSSVLALTSTETLLNEQVYGICLPVFSGLM